MMLNDGHDNDDFVPRRLLHWVGGCPPVWTWPPRTWTVTTGEGRPHLTHAPLLFPVPVLLFFLLRSLVSMFETSMFRYSYEGLSEDMHTWFFLYDEKVAAKHEAEGQRQVGAGEKRKKKKKKKKETYLN